MPIHDWTRVRANRFHHFHQTWTARIAAALNGGSLPPGYFALAEQIAGGPEPDVVTLSLPNKPAAGPPGVAVSEVRPTARHVAQSEADLYARKADRITVRHPDGDVVAVIEIVSPGNKESRHAVKAFARKAVQFLRAGVHLLIVDLFPPSKRDPRGVHKLVWDRLRDEEYELPPGKPLTLAAYSAGGVITGYVENVGVGDVLPDMPIFLTPDRYVPCPLETTYLAAWGEFPEPLRGPLLAPPG
jgi:hypothetical protein